MDTEPEPFFVQYGALAETAVFIFLERYRPGVFIVFVGGCFGHFASLKNSFLTLKDCNTYDLKVKICPVSGTICLNVQRNPLPDFDYFTTEYKKEEFKEYVLTSPNPLQTGQDT
jgi:hypothetical protein